MATVGLSFGSATSGSGFDVSTTVSAILAIQQGVETPWKNQISHLQSQDAVFTTLGTDLSTLTTKLEALTDFNGVLAEKEGSSSDTSVLALSSANATATAGSHEIVVNTLAQTSSVYTSAVGASDVLSGSISLQVGSGAAHTVTIDSSSNTIATLAAAINAAGIGVIASVLKDAGGSRLSLVSATSGAAGQLTTSNSLTDSTSASALTTQVGRNGRDASLTVDGIPLASSSNTVSNAVPGVTFQLLNTSSTPVQVQITNDTSAIASAWSAVVTAYNAVAKDLKGQEGKDSSGNAQPLFGDPSIALLQSALAGALLGGGASGSISSVTQLGISLNNDGSLSFSASDFESALNEHFADVVGFLQNSGSFGNNFHSVLSGLGTTSPTGVLYLAQQQNSAQESTLNKSISDAEKRAATEKTRLTKELTQANQILQAIPSQLKEVDQIYSALTGYNTK